MLPPRLPAPAMPWAVCCIVAVIDTEIRRIVLMAKLRPAVEHGATVFHAADDAGLRKLDAVMTRVLRRFVAVYENVHRCCVAHGARLPLVYSWKTQRVLEYGFRLRRMPADRLPPHTEPCVQGYERYVRTAVSGAAAVATGLAAPVHQERGSCGALLHLLSPHTSWHSCTALLLTCTAAAAPAPQASSPPPARCHSTSSRQGCRR